MRLPGERRGAILGKTYEGQLIGKGLRIGIVVSRFNEFITHRLLSGAFDALERHGVSREDIDVVWVPGAFEIPATARKLVSGPYHAVICLGAVIRGATPHFEYIAAEVTKGIAQVGLAATIPVVYGLITADTLEQAIERAGTKAGNKGWDAAVTAIEMANLWRRLDAAPGSEG
ncbi:MAG: 6,7-dimethyl-8-ribityllumazine synthase [Clostridia bacterium]|nr:6,7-dimethyl-8-ribityllumazine synthase [Clostridia bacterium]